MEEGRTGGKGEVRKGRMGGVRRGEAGRGGGGREGKTQTPSTGLRHPSLEEGAGKRCSECGKDCDGGRQREKGLVTVEEQLTSGCHLISHQNEKLAASLRGGFPIL